MSSRRQEHEAYLKKVLFSSSNSSNRSNHSNPSEKAFKKTEMDSYTYFNNLKLGLMNKYKDWNFSDIEGSKVIENIYGETLRITKRKKN